jgi:hypothetical protein
MAGLALFGPVGAVVCLRIAVLGAPNNQCHRK